MTEPEEEPGFDERLAQLEQKVRELESGKLGLDAALKHFEDGIALTRELRKRLDAAEGKVEELLADGTKQDLDVDG